MLNDLSEPDRRLNIESRLLAVLSNFGGERLVADGPRMPELITQLADETEALAREGFLPEGVTRPNVSGVEYRCPGVDSTGHGLTEAATHAAGCCDRFAALPAAEQAATGLRYPATAPSLSSEAGDAR